MPGTIKFETDNEPVVLNIEGSNVEAEGMVRIGARDQLNNARQSLSESLNGITDIVNAVDKKLSESAKYPDEVKLDIGIKVSVESGAIIAKAGGEAHINLSLTWKK